MSIGTEPADWKCGCGRLLGQRHNGRIRVNIGKRHRLTIRGEIISICPHCGKENVEQTTDAIVANK
jgi:hypothetical protein